MRAGRSETTLVKYDVIHQKPTAVDIQIRGQQLVRRSDAFPAAASYNFV